MSSNTDVKLSDRLAEEFASGDADLERGAVLPGIPAPSDDMVSVVRAVRALKTVVDTLTGASGTVLDKALTTRDMLRDGQMVYTASGGLVSAGGGTTVVVGDGGTGNSGEDWDTRPILAVPPAPTNLSALGAFRNIILTWDLLNYRNHAYTEILRHTADNVAQATVIGTATANQYVDASAAVNTPYYYWVRAVNFEAVVGPVNATPGTLATLAIPVAEVLDALTGEITESQLYDALSERIDLIDGPDTLPGSVAARIKVESDERETVDGHMAASYVVRTEVSGNGQTIVGGFGLMGTSGGTAGPTIDFGVRANRFWVAPPSGTDVPSRLPFIVQATETTEGGVVIPAGVYMDAAYIINLTAQYARFQQAVADQIVAAEIDVAQLTGGTMTVGSFIQSQSYSEGSSGWKLNSNGSGEMNSLTARGWLYGGAATGYDAGVGFYSGYISGGQYRWRVGNPGGARIQWTGSALEIYDANGQPVLASGGGATLDSLVENVIAGNSGSMFPATFGALTPWTNSRGGDPNTVATATATLVTNDANFGKCAEFSTWTAVGTSVLTKGVAPAIAGRIYRVFARFKVTASNGAASFNLTAAPLNATYTDLGNTVTTADGTITGVGDIVEMTGLFSDTTAHGAAAWPAGTAYLRFGLRLNSAETGLTLRVQSMIVDDVTESTVANADAAAALQAALTAQEDVNEALIELNDITSDSRLSPVEKTTVRTEWDAAYGERASIRSQADSFAVTTEKAAYDSAFQSLGTYLNGGTAYAIGGTPPLWLQDAQLGVSTDIVGATFRGQWTTFYTARQELLNKIAEEAGKRAAWSNLTGTVPSNVNNGNITLSGGSGTIQINGAGGGSVGGVLMPNYRITSSNVSSYIASAAIGSAYIGVLTASNLTVTALSNTVNGGLGSGARVVISSNRIDVYDSSNFLRVRMGVW